MARSKKKSAGERLTVKTTSGYTLVVKRPSLTMIRALNAKAMSLYPDPDAPGETIESVTGVSYHIADRDSDEYKVALHEVHQQRLSHTMEFVFQHCLEVEGHETDEAKQALVDLFAGERALLEEWGEVPEDMADLDEWQFTLRTFILSDGIDYAALMVAASSAMDEHGITEVDIRQRVSFL